MTSVRNLGRIIGVLLIIHLAIGLIVPYVLLRPLTTLPAGFLETAAGMALQVRINVFLLFVGGILPVVISGAAWPAFRQRGYGLGFGLLALAVVNMTLQVVENSHWLTLLSVSQAYAEASAADAGQFGPLAVVVRSAWKWAHYSHILVVVGWIFAFYGSLYVRSLVPRPLAALGLATSLLQFTGITLPVFLGFRMPFAMLFGMPLGLANLLLAAWLMAKGFRESPTAPRAEAHGAEAVRMVAPEGA